MSAPLRLLLSGCGGHMGRTLAELCRQTDSMTVCAGIDPSGRSNGGFPVYPSPDLCTVQADVAVDFSTPAALEGLLDACLTRKLPLVLATTGHSPDQLSRLEHAADRIPIFRAANMAFGANVLPELVRTAASALGEDYDIEIVEAHHRRKVDAPSGTALMLAEAVCSVRPQRPQYIFDRPSLREKRGEGQIGFSSIRGGTIVGEHTVLFAGQDEVIEITHRVGGREVFAAGALRAARFLAGVSRPGLYSMSDLVP